MNIEQKVNIFVKEHIRGICDLRIEHLAHVLDIKIGFNDDYNYYVRSNGYDIIFLRHGSTYEMWSAFCHELGHMILHSTRQPEVHRMFNEYQENQADKFALLLMMPESLLLSCDDESLNANAVSINFGVPFALAVARLEMLLVSLKYGKD